MGFAFVANEHGLALGAGHKTSRAVETLGRGGRPQTVRATPFPTRSAPVQATITSRYFASDAACHTAGTKLVPAGVAPDSIFTRNAVAALVAPGAVPFIQPHVRTFFVVMLQNTAHEAERVRQASLFECSTEGGSSLAGT